MDIVNKLVEAFMMRPGDFIQWLTASCQDAPLSKTLFFMLLMQSLHKMNSSSGKVLAIVYTLTMHADDQVFSISEYRKIFVSYDKLSRCDVDGCVFP